MSKKTSIFDFLRGKIKNDPPKVTNIQAETTKSVKAPDSYEEYLKSCPFSNFSGFMIDSKYTRDKFPEDYAPQFDTIMYTCKQVFVISGIHYYIYPVAGTPGRFVCFVNYESNDIRVIVEFIKTLLYSNTNYIGFNLFYIIAHNNPEEVLDDMNFLLNMPPYSLFFGYNKKIRAFFFKDCEMTPDPIDSSAFTNALKEGRMEEALNVLSDRKELFTRIIHTDFRYSYRSMYNFLIDTYLALGDLYGNDNEEYADYNKGFEEFVAEFEDAAHFLDRLIEDLEKYAESNPAYTSAAELENELIRNVKEYIKNNVSTVTLATIATHFNISYAHLSRVFKKNVKQNFTEYVADVKLELATSLLTETNKNISEISAELGYNSPSYFLNRFKDRYGVTPSVYRKQYHINK